MPIPQFSWEKFSRSIIINKKPEEVFLYIATAKGLTKWLLEAASFFTLANETQLLNRSCANEVDSYHWVWKGKNYELQGQVLDCDVPRTRFSFTFGEACTVDIVLTEHGGSTLLKLTQQATPGKTYDQMRHVNSYAYWTFFLTNLKSVVEHEIDLREDTFTVEGLLNV